MKCIECGKEFTKQDSQNENVKTGYAQGEMYLFHAECPVQLEDTYDFVYYLHNNYSHDEVIDNLTDRGMPEPVAEEIAERRPFYEVKLDVTYDRVTDKFTVNKVTL